MTNEEQQLEDFQRDNEAAINAFQQKNAISDTLAALEQIAQAYAGLPGRKVLIWASGGFPFLIEDPHSVIGMSTELVSSYERTWRALNAANIAVYPVNAEGLVNSTYAAFDVTKRNAPNFGPPRLGRPPAYDSVQQTRDTMKSFAEATGGKPCLDRNDLATCFNQATKDSDFYYMLTYYLPEEDRKPGWHKLKVSVNRKDISVRARSGFFVPDHSKPSPQVLQQPKPSYTEKAKEARIEGIMLVSAVIRKNGSVDQIKVIKGLGYGLDESAVNTISREWKFKPGTLNDEPVDVSVVMEVSFRLY